MVDRLYSRGRHMNSFMTMDKKERTKRLIMTFGGVITCGISVGLYKLAAFGVDPFQVLLAGFDKIIPLEFGLVSILLNVAMLSFSFFADRHYISIATFINLLFFGYIVQYSLDFFKWCLPGIGVPGRIVCFLIAVVVMCFGSAMYFTSDLGVSTYDAIALIISGTWHFWEFKYVRIVTDLICVICGVVLYLIGGGKVSEIPTVAGVGTIVTAFFMGPLIEFFNVKFARPFLYGKGYKEKK